MKKVAKKTKKLVLTKMNITVLSSNYTMNLKGGDDTNTTTTSGASFIDDCLTQKPQTWEPVCKPQ